MANEQTLPPVSICHSRKLFILPCEWTGFQVHMEISFLFQFSFEFASKGSIELKLSLKADVF